MANQPPNPGTGDDRGRAADSGSTTGAPRWVKVFLTIAVTLVLLFVLLQFVGGGGHGPGRHGVGGGKPPAGVTEHGGHAPSPGIDHGAQQP